MSFARRSSNLLLGTKIGLAGLAVTVKVINNKTGETFSGKYAVLRESEVSLFSGIMSDKKGGFRGCGKKRVFPRQDVAVEADNPTQELKSS